MNYHYYTLVGQPTRPSQWGRLQGTELSTWFGGTEREYMRRLTNGIGIPGWTQTRQLYYSFDNDVDDDDVRPSGIRETSNCNP